MVNALWKIRLIDQFKSSAHRLANEMMIGTVAQLYSLDDKRNIWVSPLGIDLVCHHAGSQTVLGKKIHPISDDFHRYDVATSGR